MYHIQITNILLPVTFNGEFFWRNYSSEDICFQDFHNFLNDDKIYHVENELEIVKAISVDDEPIVHEMLAGMVRESGLPVEMIGSALNVTDALELVREKAPDILLLDIRMDDSTGLELMHRLNQETAVKPYVIFITAYDSFEYARDALRLGAGDYILKPIRMDDLTTALKRAVNNIQSQHLKQIESRFVKDKLEKLLPNSDYNPRTRTSAVVDIVKEYIHKNYNRHISLTTAADAINLSAGHLGTIFRNETGVSFRAYLRSIRIARAKELLQDHTLNISQIAEMVGYDALNYFSEAFKEETGIRPSDYRGAGKRWVK